MKTTSSRFIVLLFILLLGLKPSIGMAKTYLTNFALQGDSIHMIFLSLSNIHPEVGGSNENLAINFKEQFPLVTRSQVFTHFVEIGNTQSENLEGADSEVIEIMAEDVDQQINDLVEDNKIRYFFLFSPTNFHRKDQGLKARYTVTLVSVLDQKLLWQNDFQAYFDQVENELTVQKNYIVDFIQLIKSEELVAVED